MSKPENSVKPGLKNLKETSKDLRIGADLHVQVVKVSSSATITIPHITAVIIGVVSNL